MTLVTKVLTALKIMMMGLSDDEQMEFSDVLTNNMVTSNLTSLPDLPNRKRHAASATCIVGGAEPFS